MAFDKNQAEYNLKEMGLTHKFALRMALIICWSVVSIVVLFGIFTGATTPIALIITASIAIILGVVSFSVTRSALV
jgi:hypothetical protein